MPQYFYVALGGALGAVGRYLVSGWVQNLSGSFFPWGTVSVNALGSFLLGFVLQAGISGGLGAEYRLLLAVGFLGAFTTFSTFAYEALELLRLGQGWQMLEYIGINLVGGLLLVALGMAGYTALRGL
ncbi:fluoride efflux transporter CrcB [Oceanithermus sp.]